MESKIQYWFTLKTAGSPLVRLLEETYVFYPRRRIFQHVYFRRAHVFHNVNNDPPRCAHRDYNKSGFPLSLSLSLFFEGNEKDEKKVSDF